GRRDQRGSRPGSHGGDAELRAAPPLDVGRPRQLLDGVLSLRGAARYAGREGHGRGEEGEGGARGREALRPTPRTTGLRRTTAGRILPGPRSCPCRCQARTCAGPMISCTLASRSPTETGLAS